MPWKGCTLMDERLGLVARMLDAEAVSEVCREFGISRKIEYKIFICHKDQGLEALCDRSRRRARYTNQRCPGMGWLSHPMPAIARRRHARSPSLAAKRSEVRRLGGHEFKATNGEYCHALWAPTTLVLLAIRGLGFGR